MNDLGTKMAQKRKDLGLTQTEFAEKRPVDARIPRSGCILCGNCPKSIHHQEGRMFC